MSSPMCIQERSSSLRKKAFENFEQTFFSSLSIFMNPCDGFGSIVVSLGFIRQTRSPKPLEHCKFLHVCSLRTEIGTVFEFMMEMAWYYSNIGVIHVSVINSSALGNLPSAYTTNGSSFWFGRALCPPQNFQFSKPISNDVYRPKSDSGLN